MLTHWKNIAVFLDESSASIRLGEYAAAIAGRHQAHLIGIYGVSRAGREVLQTGSARGPAALQEVLTRRQDADEAKVLSAGRHFGAISRSYHVSAEFRVVWGDLARDETGLHSLHSDLVIVGHPETRGLPGNWTPDRMLRTTGIPVLHVPNTWEAADAPDNVLIAWNASRESRRAIADAMPFITNAGTVTVLVIDSDQGKHDYGAEPGADVALNLARHGARVQVEQVASEGAPVADVILSCAAKWKANLLVVGARSHARSTEILFGGVTKSLLSNLNLPVLMSR